MSTPRPRLAVIGATGDLGNALARRWARAGHPVVIGSRDPARAQRAAAAIREALPGTDVSGAGNVEAAAAGEIVVLTVPFAHQERTLEAIRGSVAGRLLVDTTVPLRPPRVARVQLPPEGCAAAIAARVLGETTSVCSAFHDVAAHKLADLDRDVDCDVLVFGDSAAERERVVALARAAGLRGVHGGPLANSAAAEALTSVLIHVNRRYGADGAGIRITGLSEAGAGGGDA